MFSKSNLPIRYVTLRIYKRAEKNNPFNLKGVAYKLSEIEKENAPKNRIIHTFMCHKNIDSDMFIGVCVEVIERPENKEVKDYLEKIMPLNKRKKIEYYVKGW